MLVEAQNLSFSIYREDLELRILENINLQIAQSEFVSVQGPSGSGKTTLMHCLGTLQTPSQGKVLIEGHNPYALCDLKLAQFRATQIGFIFQQFHVFPNLTLLENILVPSWLPFENSSFTASLNDQAMEMASEVGIAGRLDHYPHQVSGGQLQRLIIARALLRRPRILFADEPTGNLDTKTAREIIDIFARLNQTLGQTILLITHDTSIAGEASRQIVLVDGEIESDFRPAKKYVAPLKAPTPHSSPSVAQPSGSPLTQNRFIFQNIRNNLRRSLLTMLGIFVGIAATFFLGSLGTFIQRKVVDSYQDLGVSAFRFHAYQQWQNRSSTTIAIPYSQLSFRRDIYPMRKLFPELESFSPLYINWADGRATYGGRKLEESTKIFGVSSEFFKISSWDLQEGKLFDPYKERIAADVCVLGSRVKQKLYDKSPAAGTMLELSFEDKTSVCKVLGVMTERNVGSSWDDPNDGIFVPYTSFSSFSSQPPVFMSFLTRVIAGGDVGEVATSVENYFKKKYGATGEFRADKNSLLLAQLQKFIALMRILLFAISSVCLLIGGVGLMNMMLVSVSERLSELGLLRALGASSQSLARGVLKEAIVLCAAAGLLGICFGFGLFHLALWIVSRMVPKVSFEWSLDIPSLVISLVCICAVAILSAYLPAKKASRLEIVQAIKGRD